MLSFANKFDQPAIGLDHVLGVKIACSVVLTKLLGGTQENAKAALGNSWMDGGTLNAYRHVPNAGPRKSWAGADAASRALWHALQATRGEPGYLTPLSNPQWGFEKVFLNGKTATITNTLNSFVVENIIFKFYPCQRNVSTALEAAIGLYPFIQGRLHQIKQIRIHSHDEAIRRTDKKGPLLTRAARDHCLQYIVAVGLFRGTLELDDYLDTMAKMPEIDFLREKMILLENPQFSQDHHNISIRSCANAIQIELQDGQLSDLVQVDFPKGDPIHRDKVENAIIQKFHTLTRSHWSDEKREKLIQLFQNDNALLDMSIIDFMHTLVDL
jgi:2-methylcitrate dehydratase